MSKQIHSSKSWTDSLTTKQGCFNCVKYSTCKQSTIIEEDLKKWQTDPSSGKKFAYGCACTNYEHSNRVKVQFT